MSTINQRVERLESDMNAYLPSDGAQNCGRGVKVPPGTRPLCCSKHNTTCWMRDDPVTVAKASIIFKGAVERDYAAMDAEPSPERIEVARQMLLFNGDELEYELNEEGSPPCYNPPLELVEEVRQRLLAEKYELREEIRHVMFSRED